MSFHLYRITELYSNADGSVQFIELTDSFNNEQRWQGQTIKAIQGGTTHSFTFPSDLPSTATANRFVLIATQGFADLGLVTPDFIVPANFLFTNGGTVNFANVNSVTYASLPTDGSHSINASGTVITNSPTNFAGVTGSIVPVQNHAPTVANPIADMNTNKNAAFGFVVPANTFADADAGDSLSYSAKKADGSALPAWLSFNSATRSFSGTPAAADVGVVNLRVTATDNGNLSVSEDFALTVTNANNPPSGNVAISGIARQGQTLTASNTLADADGLGSIAYQWNANGTAIAGATTASFVPTQAQVGKAITVTASYTDLAGTTESVTSTATIAVANVNDAPIAAGYANQSAGLGQPVSLNLGLLFNDPDGDALVFSASGLPGGLGIASSTGLVSGTAPLTPGVHHVTVTATDPGNASASVNFDLTVAGGNSVAVNVVTRGGDALPGVSANEFFSTTPSNSLYGFKNLSMDTFSGSGAKTLSAEIVATGSGVDVMSAFTLHGAGGATLQGFQLLLSGGSITESNAANAYMLDADNAIGTGNVVGIVTLTLPATAPGTSILDFSNAALGTQMAPDRALAYSHAELGGTGQLNLVLPDGNLAISLERGTTDLVVAGRKPITAADALDALKLSVGLAASQGSSWKELIAADMWDPLESTCRHASLSIL